MATANKATKKSSATGSSSAKKAASKTPAGRKATAKKATKKSSAKKAAAKKSPAKKSAPRRKYDPSVGKRVEREMHEMHQGKLKSGRSGKKVTNPKQAIAIALAEKRREGAKVPRNPNTKK